ncbi:MAG: hypothetical protein V1827_06545 [Candidatus Micrarchaeota archaeon]
MFNAPKTSKPAYPDVKRAKPTSGEVRHQSKIKRFLQSMLLGGALVLSPGCGEMPGSSRDGGTEAPCQFQPGPKLTCTSGEMTREIADGESVAFDFFGITLKADGFSSSGQPEVSLVNPECHRFGFPLREGESGHYSLIMDGSKAAFGLKFNRMVSTQGPSRAGITISPAGCDASECIPASDSQDATYVLSVNTLGEGESVTNAGVTVNVGSIDQSFGVSYPPYGFICPVENQKVRLEVSYSDLTGPVNVEFVKAEGECASGVEHFGVYVNEISAYIESSLYDCTAVNKKVTLTIRARASPP